MTGFLIALYEEASLITRKLSFCRIHSVGQYNGFLKGKPISLHLCGPGVKKRSHVFKWLKQHKFQKIVNIGYAGALISGFDIGEICPVNKLGRLNKNDITLGDVSGQYLITADEPIFSYDERDDLLLRTKAPLVDMEGYHLAQILAEAGIDLSQFEVYKLIGDLPGDALYLRNEVKFRNFFSSHSLWEKIRIIASTGLSSSWFLYQRKKLLQKKLFQYVAQYLKGI